MKRFVIYAALAAGALIGLWCARFGGEKISRTTVRSPSGSLVSRAVSPEPIQPASGRVEEPKLFAVSGYPPKSVEEARLWDWWRSMEKVNPTWEWERPIDFYGIVEDERSRPIAGARIALQWSALDGTPSREIISDERGRFQLTGARGKGLTVSVQKAGYHATKDSRGSFEYAAFWERNFHVAKPDDPVVFRLRARGNPQPVLVWTTAKDIKADGKAYRFDLETGTFGSNGVLAITVTRANEKGPREFDFTVQIRVSDGGGLVISQDDLMFEAPASGYVSEWRTDQSFGKSNYSQVQRVQFYVKTPQEKYAAVRAQIAQMADPEAQVQMTVFYNPSGSRNLEFDADSRLNP